VLDRNKRMADAIREDLRRRGCFMVNIIGSPGCGKTRLLVELLALIGGGISCAVIEGDLATDNDAQRIRKTGVDAFQVMTGAACHLSARDIEHALEHLSIQPKTLVLVENVGNLVCPSMFDIGESLRIVCLSVTEGTDKPQKYPVSFREADLAVITKSDLAPYVDFDMEACREMISRIKPDLPFLVTSAKDGSGLKELIDRIVAAWRDKQVATD
jgi:hydrogenase nickel incorporation protein HypB